MPFYPNIIAHFGRWKATWLAQFDPVPPVGLEITAIEKELGLVPKHIFSDVAERIRKMAKNSVVNAAPWNSPDGFETAFVVGCDVEKNTLAVYVNGVRTVPTLVNYGQGRGSLDGDVSHSALTFDVIWPLNPGTGLPWPSGDAPLSPPFYLTFDVSGEILKCTALGGAQNRTLTVEREQFGTEALDTDGDLTMYILAHFTLADPPGSDAVILLDYQQTTLVPTGL